MIENFDLSVIPKTFKKITGNPLGAMAATGAVAAGGAYLASKPILSRTRQFLENSSFLTPEQKIKMRQDFEQREGEFSKRLAIGAGLLGAGVAGGFSFSPSLPGYGLTSWNMAKQAEDPSYYNPFAGSRTALPLNDITRANIEQPLVPIAFSREVINNDTFLKVDEKARLQSVISGGSDARSYGHMSAGDLVRGAVHAGFGYVGGAALGGFMGEVLGMPSPLVQGLSAAGGLAAGIRTLL